MSVKGSIVWGENWHIYHDGYDCAYFFERFDSHRRYRLPFRRPWRALARWWESR